MTTIHPGIRIVQRMRDKFGNEIGWEFMCRTCSWRRKFLGQYFHKPYEAAFSLRETHKCDPGKLSLYEASEQSLPSLRIR